MQFAIEELFAWSVAENVYLFEPETLRQLAKATPHSNDNWRLAS